MHLYTDKSLHRELVGGFEHFVFFHLLGIIILIDSYFSDGWLNHQPEKLLHRESGQSHLGVFRNGDTPIAGWFMENPIENGWFNRVFLYFRTPSLFISRRVEPSPNQLRLGPWGLDRSAFPLGRHCRGVRLSAQTSKRSGGFTCGWTARVLHGDW